MILKYDFSEVTVKEQFALPEGARSPLFPYMVDIGGSYSCGPAYYTYRNCFTHSLLLYTVSGCGEIQYRGRTVLLSEGKMILLDGRYGHRYATAQNGNWDFFWFHYIDRSPCSMADYLWERDILIQEVVFESFLEFYRKIKYFRKHTSKISDMQISQIFASYLTGWGERNFSMITPEFRTKEQLVYRAQAYIDQNYSTELTLDRLARECAVNKYYIIKLFRSFVGVTPHRYLLSVRVSQAKLLLLSTSDTVEHIGEQVGFSNCSSFLAAFKQITGITPARFRAINGKGV